ncbi:MAG: cupredoxin family copper-binding protein [Caldimonas sp.]
MRRRGWLSFSLAAGAAVAVPWLGATAAAAGARTHRVAIAALKYVPESLTVHRGDTVVWVNNDPFPHTVTATGAFDSGPIAAGASWRFVARRAGTFDYVCSLHSNMKATLTVD